MECIENENGNHVIQKIIDQLKADQVQFIIDLFKNRVYEMSVHSFGCRVMQRMIENCAPA
jgi:hypothetical protein